MAREADFIPYEPALLRGERLLILAPHPDDEVIGCGGLLAHHILEQRLVRVLVATDGGAAGEPDRRERESREAVAVLAGEIPIEFLRLPDRSLADHAEEAANRISAELRSWKPDLIAVPSPIEIHPDHSALARIFVQVVQSDPELHTLLSTARVAFYEVGQPVRPNTLVDITSVADRKYAAIARHHSQSEIRDYTAYAKGLNAYRAMTLPADVRFAEAYWVISLPALRTTPLGELHRSIGTPPALDLVATEPLPISVVVRTKNRPGLLREAIASIRSTGYPCEIVVVNDGGESVDVPGATVVTHTKSLGRSEAGNRGVAKASNDYIAFLDDDDLLHADHFAVLHRAAVGNPTAAAWYTDAVSSFAEVGPSGGVEPHSRLRQFGSDYDRDALLADNYIPLPTLLFRRADFLAVGGFDPAFNLFEDWDFLIRLSAVGPFVRIPRVTCEIRHVTGAKSITMETPEGSAPFREAKVAVWKKHAASVTPDVLARALERQKKRITELESRNVEQGGLVHHLQVEIDRLQRESAYAREKTLEKVAGHEASMAALTSLLRDQEQQNANRAATIALLTEEVERLRPLLGETQTTVHALWGEIQRLQGLLDLIYGSRTWKLHSLVQKMKGRG